MRLKLKIDGRSNWDEYHNLVEDELEGWRSSVEGLQEGESVVEQVWLAIDWKERVTRACAADKGIGKKKPLQGSKNWWCSEVEEAIEARKKVCKKLRYAREREGPESSCLKQLWEEYKQKRKSAKRIIRRIKSEKR